MRRREFLGVLGSAAAAWPLAVRAQAIRSSASSIHRCGGRVSQRLSEAGYVEGRNVAIELRATGQNDRLPALAAELVRHPVTVIAALGGFAAYAAKAATTTIPIVFSIGGDPVELGLVGSLNRPGGNVTGATFFAAQLLQKQIGLLHELVPKAAVLRLFR